MFNQYYEIQHSWGDPREGTYRNNWKVSYAYYKEGDVYLVFSMFPLKSEGSSSIVMEVPANIRMLLGNDWAKCEIVIQRVVQYLKALDESKSHRKYDSIIVDTSKVKKWLPTQIKLFGESHRLLNDTLPAASTASFIITGLMILGQKEFHFFSALSAKYVDWALIAIGVAIFSVPLLDVYKRLMFCFCTLHVHLFRSWSVKDVFEFIFMRYWRRYILTLCISLLFICEGLR